MVRNLPAPAPSPHMQRSLTLWQSRGKASSGVYAYFLTFADDIVLSSARSWEVFGNSFISFCQADPQKTLWGQRCYTSSVIIDLGFEISLS